ncbi:MAG: hypothetical protein QF381_02975 [Nitrososphaerales archaeon]|jgi:hypothetical protein|nr:hypothetical protein [Nitrososphaerales archaeon]
MKDFRDIVICGPDMSGTSTQIRDGIKYFQNKGMGVRDIRGTEIDALFHTRKFQRGLSSAHDYFSSFGEFLDMANDCALVSTLSPRDFLWQAYELLSGGETNQDLSVASMVETPATTYIDPRSAEVWVMEEPSKRGAGQSNRVIEQHRSEFGMDINPVSAAMFHQGYRTSEFLRFRGPIRNVGGTILRSRSEESACYQVRDDKDLPGGISMDDYLNLPGHRIAFANAPTDIFVVCGPEDWTSESYLKLKERRGVGRSSDDHENDPDYQVLVNNRYASDWLENLYDKGCGLYGGVSPKIHRFSIYDSMNGIKSKMQDKLDEIVC